MSFRVVQSALLLGLVLLTPFAAHADQLSTQVHGSYRLLYWNQSDLNLGLRDPSEPMLMLGQQNFVEHRARVGALLKYGKFSFDIELDALNGLINAPTEGVLPALVGPEAGVARPEPADPQRNRAYGLSLNSFALRKAMATYRSKIGQFSAGATTFGWGQGFLSNSGSGPRPESRGGREVLDEEFGDRRYGDRSLRVMYATRPLHALSGGRIGENFSSIIGFDMVLQDETAKLIRPTHESVFVPDGAGFLERSLKDRSYQAVLALRHQKGGYSSGLFMTRRWLNFANKRVADGVVTQPYTTDLDAWAFDLSLDYRKGLGETTEFYAAVEGALVVGSTNHVRNASCPGTDDETRCSISQQGLVARTGLKLSKFTVDLLGGYASGDGNPFDSTVTNFRSDRDFKVGLILFDQVIAWQSAAQVRRAADPTITNEPNAGLELLSTSGAVSNAVFLNPTVRFQATQSLSLMGGALWGMAPERYTDAFWLTRTSAKTNLFGQPAGKNYGFEFDIGANYSRSLTEGVDFLFGVQAGYFLPGDAFVVDETGKTMDPVYLAKLRTAVVF